jgi:hypothetical protein
VRRSGLKTPKSTSSFALGCLVRAQSCDRASGTECDGHWVFLTEEDFICCRWGTTCVDECAADRGGGFVDVKGIFELKIYTGKGRKGAMVSRESARLVRLVPLGRTLPLLWSLMVF